MIHKEDRTFGSMFVLDSARCYSLRLSIRLVRPAFNVVRRTGARMLVWAAGSAWHMWALRGDLHEYRRCAARRSLAVQAGSITGAGHVPE